MSPFGNEMVDEAKLSEVFAGMLRDAQKRKVRPAVRMSNACPIQMDLTVLDIWNSDVKTESFCAKLKVLMKWVCPTDHAEEAMREGGDLLDTDWEPEWFPRISIASTTEKTPESVAFIASRDSDGIVWITGEWIFTIHVLEAYDLHSFPFDVQDFNLVLGIDNAAMPIELKSLPSIHKRGSEFLSKGGEAHLKDGCPVRVEASGLELPDFRTLLNRRKGSNWLESPAYYRATKGSEVHVVLLCACARGRR